MSYVLNPKFSVAKQYEYREPFWGAADVLLPKIPVSRRHVVILDTGKALETKYLLQLGYDPSKIHVVNHNPSHIAWVTMRKLLVKTHCAKLAVAVENIGQMDVVNYDSMGTVGADELASTIIRIAGLLAPGAVLGVTVLASREVKARDYIYRTRGRTIPGLSRALPEYSYQDLNRFDYLVTLCNFADKTVRIMKTGRYRSRSLDMLWVAMRLGPRGPQRMPKFV